jgi:hypothetical protein
MLGSGALFCCFTLVAIMCVLVNFFHSQGIRVLLGGLDMGKVPFLSILDIFHLDNSHCHMFWK